MMLLPATIVMLDAPDLSRGRSLVGARSGGCSLSAVHTQGVRLVNSTHYGRQRSRMRGGRRRSWIRSWLHSRQGIKSNSHCWSTRSMVVGEMRAGSTPSRVPVSLGSLLLPPSSAMQLHFNGNRWEA